MSVCVSGVRRARARLRVVKQLPRITLPLLGAVNVRVTQIPSAEFMPEPLGPGSPAIYSQYACMSLSHAPIIWRSDFPGAFVCVRVSTLLLSFLLSLVSEFLTPFPRPHRTAPCNQARVLVDVCVVAPSRLRAHHAMSCHVTCCAWLLPVVV